MTDTLPRFVPVIFANGEDDDLLGFEAAIQNEPVLFDNHIYETGETLVIEGRVMRFSVHLIVIVGTDADERDMPKGYVIREGKPPRPMVVRNCAIQMAPA